MLAHHLPSTVPTALPATQEQRKLPLPPFHGRRLRAASQRYPKIEGRVSCSFHTVQTSDFGSTASRVDDMPEERSKAPPSVAVPVRALTMPCVPTHAGQVYSSQVPSHRLTSLDQVGAHWIDRRPIMASRSCTPRAPDARARSGRFGGAAGALEQSSVQPAGQRMYKLPTLL